MWLGCSKNAQLALKDEEYIDAIRLRLLIPFYFKDGDRFRRCPCNKVDSEDNFGYHCLSCPHMRCTIRRHNELQTATKTFLERLGKPTQLEVLISDQRQLRADVRYQEQGTGKYIDVTVINPTSDIYSPPAGQMPVVGQASTIQEERKIRKYVTEGGLEAERFIPFVVEATGALGPKAQAWVDEMTDAQGEESFLSTHRCCDRSGQSSASGGISSHLSRGNEGNWRTACRQTADGTGGSGE